MSKLERLVVALEGIREELRANRAWRERVESERLAKEKVSRAVPVRSDGGSRIRDMEPRTASERSPRPVSPRMADGQRPPRTGRIEEQARDLERDGIRPMGAHGTRIGNAYPQDGSVGERGETS